MADSQAENEAPRVVITTFDRDGGIQGTHPCRYFDVYPGGLVRGYREADHPMMDPIPVVATTGPCRIEFEDDKVRRGWSNDCRWRCDVAVHRGPKWTNSTDYYGDCMDFHPHNSGVTFVSAGRVRIFVNMHVTAANFKQTKED